MPAPYWTPKAALEQDLLDEELESGALADDSENAWDLGDAEADEAREAEADYFETWRDEAEADIYATAEDF